MAAEGSVGLRNNIFPISLFVIHLGLKFISIATFSFAFLRIDRPAIDMLSIICFVIVGNAGSGGILFLKIRSLTNREQVANVPTLTVIPLLSL